MQKSIIDPKKSYTFSDYFALNPPIEELLAYFGYTQQIENYVLPHNLADLTHFAHLKTQLETHLRYVDLTSEVVRREVLVAPIVFNLASYFKMKVYVEYALHVDKQLKGKLDYYLHRNSNLLIIEAKNDDLGRGFTQLAVELIALDKWLEEDNKPLYGSVSIGNVWQFAMLNRASKVITQDINSYSVPTDLQELLQILIAMLDG